jgi:acyl carrier protein
VQADAGFVDLLQEVLKLNPAEMQDEQELKSLREWDSMSHLVIASWIHRESGHLVSAEEIKQVETIGGLRALYAEKV